MISLILLVNIALIWQGSYAQQDKQFFRNDYTYLEETRSFYKVHTLVHPNETWAEAKKRCYWEGARLFYPENEVEAKAVLALWNQTQPTTSLYVGVSALLSQGVYDTFDGKPVIDVYHNWSPGEPNDIDGEEVCAVLRADGTLNDDRCDRSNQYICKKTIDSLQWNADCNSPYVDYEYNAESGKCYKFHLRPQNWTDAYTICNAEQSYLAVIESKEEDAYLVKLIADADKDGVQGDYVRGAVHVGFYKKPGTGWVTIKGDVPLADSGFGEWVGGQPDGGDRENCGSIFYTGELNDMACSTRCFFICEHEVDVAKQRR